MILRKFRTFVADFETTVYDGQENTLVWASAIVELGSEDVKLFGSINDTFDYLKDMEENLIIYYHNLKFDGSFWLHFLMSQLNYQQAYTKLNDDGTLVEWIETKNMRNETFKYSISDRGQWYTIIIKVNNKIIEFRDSYKLLPFKLKRIGESFKTKHQKLEMEYKGFRYPNCPISEQEKEYIKNDVLVIKEALEITFAQGHDKLTIGACCLAEYKKIVGKQDWETLFPDMYEIEIDEQYNALTVGDYIRKSYRGGWCYVVKGKANKVIEKGVTADVNSLYPSMMSAESGNRYPVGKPVFWKGNYIPDEALRDDAYYFVRVKTRFYLKDGYLPFIQIKNSLLYRGNDCLETSDYFNQSDGKYYPFYQPVYGNHKGEVQDTRVVMTLTMTDYELIKEHYELVDFEILDGCYFGAIVGLFDRYIDKYRKIKMESKGALRELAKLFLNNLYGKMASNTNSSFKIARLKPDNSLGYITVPENNKKAGYIPVGSAITSYARNFTIRAAQKNYYGADKRGFIYADTDSIHCDLEPEEVKGITVDPVKFCCWKLESTWDKAIFVRQKTYIEHVIAEDLKPIESPYYNVKCAGMSDVCKDLFIKSMTGYKPTTDEEQREYTEKYDEEKRKFIETKRELTDFKIGLVVPGMLKPMQIDGGTLLVEAPYHMRPQ